MVFTVRCFECGDSAVRLVLGGRAILHARCHACGTNLLAEVLGFEQEVMREKAKREAAENAAITDPPTGEFDPGDLEADDPVLELVESA